MNREQEEMQSLGLFGVYRESYKILLSWRKIFSQITFTLILPLSFTFLMRMEVSNVLSGKIWNHKEEMIETPQNTPKYQKLSEMISSEEATFLLFRIVYFTLALIFSLLSTSAVVYTIASIYTGREVTFNKVMSVVPKVWKRLIVTFLCTASAFFAYTVIAVLVFLIWVLTIGIHNIGSGSAVFVLIELILYVAGLVYLSVIWQLANVVSVLEDSYGFEAMTKSQKLIKGKMGLSIFIFLMINISFFLIEFLFEMVVVHGRRLGPLDRTAYGIVCFLLLSHLLLFGLVLQTVLYFVCKSYHHENIDKPSLSDHLQVYLEEYMPLKAKDVQLEQCHV